MKILFITSNRLGDGVLTTGLLAWLIDRNPDARLTIACGPHAAGLFRSTPGVERLIVLHKRSWHLHWIRLWRECVGTKWDLVVDLRNSGASRLLRARRRVHGGRNSGEAKVVELAQVLAIEPPPAPHIWIEAGAQAKAAAILPSGRPVLALGPAANWFGKQWPIERFAALAERLTGSGGPLEGAAVLVAAGASEREQIEPLLRAIPARDRIEALGLDLLVVAACLKQARLFVGNDSGLMHLAAAVGAPTLGLFGPGDERIYGPWGERCAIVRTPESRSELLNRLRHSGDRTINLMQGLDVGRAERAARELIERTALPLSGAAT